MPTPDLRPRIWEEFGVRPANYGKSLRLAGESAGRFTLSLRAEAGGAFALPRAWLRPMRRHKLRRNRMGQLIAWLRRPEQSPRIVFLPWLDRTQDYPKERPHELLVPSRPDIGTSSSVQTPRLSRTRVSRWRSVGASNGRRSTGPYPRRRRLGTSGLSMRGRTWWLSGLPRRAAGGSSSFPSRWASGAAIASSSPLYGGGDAATAKLEWSEAAGAAVTLTGKRRVPRGQTGTQKDEPRRRRWAELTVQLLGPDGQPIVGERVRRLPAPMPFGTDALALPAGFPGPALGPLLASQP